MIRNKLYLIFGVILAVVSVTVGENYPPGVPNPDLLNNDIKYHEPADFANNNNLNRGQQQQQQQQFQGGQQQHQQQQQQHQPQQTRQQGPNKRHSHHPQIPVKQDREHLKKHTNEQYVKVEELSQPQLIMQQFRNFDLDKNGKIDGLELLKAAAQMNDEHAHGDDEEEPYDQFDFEEMAEEADETLNLYDENKDGFIHYGEFYRNHKKLLDAEKNENNQV